MAGNSAQSGVSVASRVLALLGAFDAEHRALTLSEMARRAGLPLPTAHRLVSELVDWGALVRRSSGEYVIGRRLWDLGLLSPTQSGLRQVASPFLHDIYGATLATVHLAVRDELEVLYLDRLSGHASVPVVSQIGSRLPLHATGVGKVLLAYAPGGRPDRRAVRPHPHHALHDHAARAPARSAPPGASRGVCDDGRGDEPRRVLRRGADPGVERSGRRGARHRGP